MRSLVFIALLGLALAVPVPHAQPQYDDNSLFESNYYEQDEDCIDTQPAYHPSDEIYDAAPEEYVNQDDCEGDEIEEAEFINIEIPEKFEDFEPANVGEDDLVQRLEEEPISSDDMAIGNNDYSNEAQLDNYYDEECEEDEVEPTEAPVVTEAPAEPADLAGDCVGDDYEAIEEEEYEDYEDMDLDDVNVLDHAERAYDSNDLILDMSDEEFIEEENCEY